MKTFIRALVIMLLLTTSFQKGYSQDSIIAKHWQLKSTINLGLHYLPIPDSIYDLYPMLREDTTLKKNNWMVDKSSEDPKIEWTFSIYLFKKSNNFYILRKFDTLIYPPTVNVNIKSPTDVLPLIKINSKQICFLHGFSNKAMPDSIFVLDDNLIFISGEKPEILDLNNYKTGNINFSSTARLNSVYDLFEIDKYAKLTSKGKISKLNVINEFAFVNEVKIKNIDEELKELEKNAKYYSKTKKGMFDDIFEGDKKEEIK